MNRRQLLLRLLFKAAWVRKDRALTALVSVAVVATIATAALTIYSDLEGKLGREFRGFGANVIVTKASGAVTADELVANQCRAAARVQEWCPWLMPLRPGRNDAKVVVGGADLTGFARAELLVVMSARLMLPGQGLAWLSRAQVFSLHPEAIQSHFRKQKS